MHRTHSGSCLVILLSSMLLVQPSLSQQSPRGQGRNSPEMLQAMTDTLVSILELSEEQIPSVHAILANRTESLMALQPKPGGSREQFRSLRAKRQEINKETELALTELLSSEQMASYRRFMERRTPERVPRMRRRNRQDTP